MSERFEGYYHKHQKDGNTLCLVVGHSGREEFIQIITQDASYQVPVIGTNQFSKDGVKLNIRTEAVCLKGEIAYGELSPIRYDIMGPFAHLPMQCRHGIISMKHTLAGGVSLNGQDIDFTGGTGYIEMDAGRSFPKSYVWVQSNDFDEDCSIMASVADIPFCGFHFRGCICVIHYQGKEYRLATYLGVRVLACTEEQIALQQGKYRFEIEIPRSGGHPLRAPNRGEMNRTILERAACPARFRFFHGKETVFDLASPHTSFEYEQ